ncbi:MAG: 3-oxoacyl-[acyl-carrier-protein] synthase II [Candidatus Azotimanducaceae bacterium]|jgi:3-oxoacyl-[acyl-carrier-protein] synthase II
MGMVSPLGSGVEKVWQRLIEGKSGIGTIDRFDIEDSPVKIAGLVPTLEQDPEAGLNIEPVITLKEKKKLGLFTTYALVAAQEALTQAGWFPQSEQEQVATATIIATGIGGFPTITEAHKTLETRGHKRISPFVVPAFLANLAAGNISIKYGFKGPMGTPVTACAAGLQAIGDGARMIASGEANIALVGGAEACVDPLSLAGFHALKALSTNNDNPQGASRPFDQNRDGFVMGEGAGLLVIESLEHALARGATPIVELSGYGTSTDAYHITSGPPDGAGATRAVQAALDMGDLNADQIDHVNAHATSTPVGDLAEIATLRNLFGDKVGDVPVTSTKSATGHLLGAAGGIESIFTAMAVKYDLIPPTLNLGQQDEAMAGFDFVTGVARQHLVSHALCNGFGFGGVNASLILSKYS